MRLKMVQLRDEVMTPNGGGGMTKHFKDREYEILMEGAFVRIRSRSVSNGDLYEVPMTNVAVLHRMPEEPANDNAKGPKK